MAHRQAAPGSTTTTGGLVKPARRALRGGRRGRDSWEGRKNARSRGGACRILGSVVRRFGRITSPYGQRHRENDAQKGPRSIFVSHLFSSSKSIS